MASTSGTEDEELQQLSDQGSHYEGDQRLDWAEVEALGRHLLDGDSPARPVPRATSVTDNKVTEDEGSQRVARPTSPRGEVGTSQGGSARASTEARETALKARWRCTKMRWRRAKAR